MAAKYEPPKGLPTVFDPSYKGAGQKPGLEIWRIEKFQVVKKPASDPSYQGTFFQGDSYIILQTKKRDNALERHIFFWLGADTTQDEYGCAAYKTVELDESLGGEPVQHREVQGHETAQFLALFKNGVKYVAGGVDTGFKHVDREAFTTRLLHIKGRRNIRVLPVELSPKSMNTGDVFVLDAGRDIFQWNGNEASRVEKAKGLEVVRKIRDEERSGKARIHIVEQGGDEKLFWEKFGCAPTKITSKGQDDDEFTRVAADKIKLLKISDASGKMSVTDVTKKPLTPDMLVSDDSMILDSGHPGAGIYVWVGKGANQSEKLHSMKYAAEYLKTAGYPNHTPITRLVEGGETPLFKQFFANWMDPNALKPGQQPGGQKRKFEKKAFDVKTMQARQAREKARMVDDGSGKLQIWRIEDFEMVELDKKLYGQFFGGDSYVLLYTYLHNSKEMHIIYFWQGNDSSQDERGASALQAKNLDDKMGGEPVQVRVTQNHEPPHFYAMFKGKMVVHAGGRASGFKNRNDKDSYDTDGTRLFQVRGTNELNTRAIQVPEKAASLNSGDMFILESPKAVYLWNGQFATGDEREFAKNVAKSITPREYEIVLEGKEPAGFWEALGGKADYAKFKSDPEELPEPRLFQCSNAKGYFYVEEVFDFAQDDLIEDDVMILDTYHEVFVWVGNGANFEEKKMALETAIKYIETDTSGRTPNTTTILQIKQGFEPPNFTCHFHAWDPACWSQGKSYDELKKELAASNPKGDLGSMGPTSATAVLSAFSGQTYTMAQLTAKDLPEGVDPTKKEQYLSEDEFKKILGVSKSEFNAMPAWKGNNLKKKAGLF